LTDVNGDAALTVGYDALGNITSKSDVGAYTYGSRPHAVATAGSATYTYDGNGNMKTGDGRSNSYTVFNKPYYMSQNGNSVTIDYGPNRERFRRIDLNSGLATSTYYIGAFERISRPSGVTETKRYLDGEVIVTNRSDGSHDTEYVFTDHIGSTDVITDDTGAIVQEMSFDAFGKRRSAIDYAGYSQTAIYGFDTTHTTKGFTSHEGLDSVKLIHMNGRVYDPILGRFLSADPFVQDPTNTQSLNRYSYVFNNPLSYTDPSGYFGWKDVAKNGVKVLAAWASTLCVQAYAACATVANSVINTVFAESHSSAGTVSTVFGNGAPSSSRGGFDVNPIRDAFERCVARHE
jgi:RHS repeat-associated protein